ncbi:uncharacterized protein LOC120090445 [Benincasa hispida]|uniref:uncharacterized protein LOC120090445 n=1 Tax=Benincasa hispida TaxID=102211 RepID=UPI0019013715|nr:uncharacterized protein LOC120090445 [Benincasa hispida]
MCERNQKNRSKLNVSHTCGSQSIQQRAEKEVQVTNEEPSRIRIWELTHLSNNGLAVNETTQEKMSKLKSYASQVIDGTLDMNEDETFVRVFGPEKHGHVHGYGVGVTPSELFGSSSTIRDHERRLNESEQRLQEFEQQRKEFEQQRELEVEVLKRQISELENRFEDRFQKMMAEMCKKFVSS